MDQHDDFDNVSWRHEPESDISRPTTSGTDAEESPATSHDANGKRRMSSAHENPQAGPLADAVDLAGIGDGVLECRVDSPLKENDGTKDAYISYLVTTQVSCPVSPGVTCGLFMAVHCTDGRDIADRFQVFPEVRICSAQTIYGFLLPIQDTLSGISCLRGPTSTRQA